MDVPTEAEVLGALRTIALWLAASARNETKTAVFFDSRHNPPPGRSASAFASACRAGRHPKARRSGRVWIIASEDYFADLQRPPLAKAKPKPRKVEPPTAVDDVATLLAAGGVRLRQP